MCIVGEKFRLKFVNSILNIKILKNEYWIILLQSIIFAGGFFKNNLL